MRSLHSSCVAFFCCMMRNNLIHLLTWERCMIFLCLLPSIVIFFSVYCSLLSKCFPLHKSLARYNATKWLQCSPGVLHSNLPPVLVVARWKGKARHRRKVCENCTRGEGGGKNSVIKSSGMFIYFWKNYLPQLIATFFVPSVRLWFIFFGGRPYFCWLRGTHTIFCAHIPGPTPVGICPSPCSDAWMQNGSNALWLSSGSPTAPH